MNRFHINVTERGLRNQAPFSVLGGSMQTEGRVVLTGEVSDTPEIRVTLDGVYTASFSLKTTARRPNRAGVYVSREKRHNIIARGDLALDVRNNVRKGTRLSVEGEFNLKQWEEKSSGETKYFTRVLIDRFTSAEPDQLALPMAA